MRTTRARPFCIVAILLTDSESTYHPPTKTPKTQALCARKHLAAALPQLQRDAAAVASGLRGAAMLEYLILPPQQLLTALQPLTGPSLLVACLQGCPYLINVGVLGGGLLAPLPRLWVVFRGGGDGGVLDIGTAPEQQAKVCYVVHQTLSV